MRSAALHPVATCLKAPLAKMPRHRRLGKEPVATAAFPGSLAISATLLSLWRISENEAPCYAARDPRPQDSRGEGVAPLLLLPHG